MWKLNPFSQNFGKYPYKFYTVKIGHLEDSKANRNANRCRTYARMCSIGNLVMHFHIIVYIPWFHDTELWEGQGVGLHTKWWGYFFWCPWCTVYRFLTINLHEKLQKWLFSFLWKTFPQNLSSRLAQGLNFHFIWFYCILT